MHIVQIHIFVMIEAKFSKAKGLPMFLCTP